MAKRKQPLEIFEAQETTHIIAKIIEGRRDQARISPSWLATEAMGELGVSWMLRSTRGKFQEVYKLGHLQCRQIARALLRQAYEPDQDENKAQHPLFEGLQPRYPAAPAAGRDEPVYVRLELLSEDDWQFNLHRLRADAQSRLRHADALEAWGRRHFRLRA